RRSQPWFHIGMTHGTRRRAGRCSRGRTVGVLAALTTAGAGLVLAQAPLVAARQIGAEGTSKVTVTITDSALRLRPASVPVGRVVFTIADAGRRTYSFTIAGKSVARITHGTKAVLTVALASPTTLAGVARASDGHVLRATLTIGKPGQPIVPPAGTTT